MQVEELFKGKYFLGYICNKILLHLENPYFVNFTAVVDIVFFSINILFLIFIGSYLTIKKKTINVDIGKIFTILAVYILSIFFIINQNMERYSFLNSRFFHFDLFNSIGIKLCLFFSIIFLAFLYNLFKIEYLTASFEYIIVLLFAILGVITLLITQDLFIWFLAIELQSFALYTLASYKTNRSFLQTEAGLKYFFFGSLASSLYLFGVSLIYAITGSVNYEDIKALLYYPIHNSNIIYLGITLITVAIFLKLGVGPFHFWLPQVYNGSASIVVLFFLLIPKIGLFYILYLFSTLNLFIFNIVIPITLTIGTINAFKATSFKLFISYSTIANNAFFLTALTTTLSHLSFFAFLFIYNLIICIIFPFSTFFRKFDFQTGFVNLRDLIVIKKTNLLAAIILSTGILSLAGIPPLSGFFTKFFIILSSISTNYFGIAILLSGSLLAAFYYIRLLKILFFSNELHFAGFYNLPKITSTIIFSFSFLNIFFILNPNILLNIIL